MAELTYYDFNQMSYLGLFLNGFLENSERRGFRLKISTQAPPELAHLNLNTRSIGIFRYESATDSLLFCIDASDFNWETDAEIDYFQQILEQCSHYFKVNYNSRNIVRNPHISPYAERIKPISVVFPLGLRQSWRFLPKFSPFPVRRRTMRQFGKQLMQLRQMPSLEEFRRLRNIEQDIDVFFSAYYYPNEKYNDLNRNRLTVVEELDRRRDVNLMGGFASKGSDLPADYAKYQMPYLPYDQYLRLMARSRIGLYVRGTHGCLSFKFGELMALGRPIAGETILNNKDNLYKHTAFDQQFAFDNPSDLVERVLYLLEEAQECSGLSRANTETFERHLTPRPITTYILDELGINA